MAGRGLVLTMEEKIGHLLGERELTLATAESCTGGRLGERITRVPGSSTYFLGGVVAYSDSVKQGQLRVSPEILKRYGAVSESVALQMAEGVRRALRARLALAVTGIAGPSGGTTEKPVGTVFIALATPTGSYARGCHFSGDRQEVRERSVTTALEILLDYLQEERAK